MRTYGLLALVIAAQLVLAILAPSTALHRGGGSERLAPGGASGGGGEAGSAPGSAAAAADANQTQSALAGGGAGPAAARRAARTAGTVGAASAPSADTTHCVAGREFDPAVDYFAPPCTPGLPGKPYPGNGGATAPGVTADQIEIVDFVTHFGPGVDELAKSAGIADSPADLAAMDSAFQTFINAKYVLYGRKVRITTYTASCTTAPPDPTCIIPEIDQVVATYHPYAVLLRTACSFCHAELARLKVVSFGGMSFSDAFHQALAPYNYDVHISGTRAALAAAQWWCAQMTSRGRSGRTVAFAGVGNPRQNFNGQPRVLGVIASKDQDLEDTVRKVLYPALQKGCGETVDHEYFYESNLDTAAQQINAAMAAMDTSSDPATSVLCLCVSVAADLFFNGMQQHNYWPENVFASNQGMDWETAGQEYGAAKGQPTLGCSSPATGCEFDGALGLSEVGAPEPQDNTTGVRVFHLGGGTANDISSTGMDDVWSQYNMIASLIENTGPTLTPARMQAAAPLMGFRGGGTTGHPLRGFRPGEWTWNHDMRVVYYDKGRPSPYDGLNGTFVQVEDTRFDLGQYPTLAQPPVPPVGQRS